MGGASLRGFYYAARLRDNPEAPSFSQLKHEPPFFCLYNRFCCVGSAGSHFDTSNPFGRTTGCF